MVDIDHLEAAMRAAPGDEVVMAKADLDALFADHRRLRGRVGELQASAAVGALCADIAGQPA